LYNARELLRAYSIFNPHGTFHYIADDTRETFQRTASDWQKWGPSDPTSPHWYSTDRLRTLIAAYLREEQDGSRAKTVREFVAEFSGLKRTQTQKAVVEEAGLSGTFLHDLVVNGDVAIEPIKKLLGTMQQESRAVRPEALGVLGEEPLTQCLVRDGVVEDSVKYKRLMGTADGVPFVLEVAFGWHREDYAKKITGLNFSPALGSPFEELPTLLGEARVDSFDPVALIVHLTSPRLDFKDKGKSRLALAPELSQALTDCIKATTKHWTAFKRHADRQERVRRRDMEHWLKAQQGQYPSVKDAAYQVMARAYLWAGGADGLPANGRQIMYAARPHVLELTGGKLWKKSSYFTQHLLPDFISEHPELTKDWGSLILPVEDSIYSGISPRWAQTCDSLPDPETDAGRDGPG